MLRWAGVVIGSVLGESMVGVYRGGYYAPTMARPWWGVKASVRGHGKGIFIS